MYGCVFECAHVQNITTDRLVLVVFSRHTFKGRGYSKYTNRGKEEDGVKKPAAVSKPKPAGVRAKSAAGRAVARPIRIDDVGSGGDDDNDDDNNESDTGNGDGGADPGDDAEDNEDNSSSEESSISDAGKSRRGNAAALRDTAPSRKQRVGRSYVADELDKNKVEAERKSSDARAKRKAAEKHAAEVAELRRAEAASANARTAAYGCTSRHKWRSRQRCMCRYKW
eukprot:6199728-Pleurochrysis_carterae.AAC.4